MAASLPIAFCVICHKFTPVLEELISRLSTPDSTIFLHVDGKVSLKQFEPLKGRVHFVKPRIKVYWGHFSLTKCMLRMLDATRRTDCRYIVFLSGDTLPLRSTAEIESYLAASYTHHIEHVEMEPELRIDEMRAKVRQAHYIPKKEQHSWRFRLKYKLAKHGLLPARNRWFHTIPPLEKGSNWLACTTLFRDYAFDYLASHPDYVRCFKHAFCSDELFLHTLLGNSPFAAHNTRQGLMYVDWAYPFFSPKTLCNSDIERLAALRADDRTTPYLFARKIADEIDLAKYRKIIFNE